MPYPFKQIMKKKIFLNFYETSKITHTYLVFLGRADRTSFFYIYISDSKLALWTTVIHSCSEDCEGSWSIFYLLKSLKVCPWVSVPARWDSCVFLHSRPSHIPQILTRYIYHLLLSLGEIRRSHLLEKKYLK